MDKGNLEYGGGWGRRLAWEGATNRKAEKMLLDDIQAVYSSPSVTQMIKNRSMLRTVHVVCLGCNKLLAGFWWRDLKENGDLKELNVERRIKLKGIKICRANNTNILISRNISNFTEELFLTVVTKYIWQAAFLLPLICASSLSLIHFDLFELQWILKNNKIRKLKR